MASSTSLPSNVHISRHPCLRAKLSQLRNSTTTSKETNALVSDIALIIGCEALAANLTVSEGSSAKTPLGYDYTTETISTGKIALVPVLRSGLGMLPALQTLLPDSVSIHHLGLFREPTTLQPVEYYNNLPAHPPTRTSLAILLDPIVATGGTSAAAIQTLKEWGAEKVILLSVLGSKSGLKRAAEEWAGDGDEGRGGGVEIWVGGVDEGLNEKGMIVPGMGDVGDRMFLAMGK